LFLPFARLVLTLVLRLASLFLEKPDFFLRYEPLAYPFDYALLALLLPLMPWITMTWDSISSL